MSFVTIVAWAAGAYVAFWAVYLPVAYYFNHDAERDPDDDPTPPWLSDVSEMEQRLVVHQPYRPSQRRPSAPRITGLLEKERIAGFQRSSRSVRGH
jgi:hypothetical protein